MDEIIKTLQKDLTIFFSPQGLHAFSQSVNLHFRELQNFRFLFSNPVFDLIILLTFFILSRSWGLKKAFSYCLIVSVTLNLASRTMIYLNNLLGHPLGSYQMLIKIGAIFFITLATIYYTFVRNND